MLKNNKSISHEIDYSKNFSISTIDYANSFPPGMSFSLKVLKNKYLEKIQHISYKKETFDLAGGNYSFLFLLPAMVKVMKKKYPFIPINFKLYETRLDRDYIYCKYKCVFSAFYGSVEFNDFKNRMTKVEYETNRSVIEDFSYFCASKKAVEKFNSKEECLSKMDFAYGRPFKDDMMQEEIKYAYDTTPPNRKKEDARIISDLLFLSYLFMRYSVCMWIHFASVYDSNLVRLHSIAKISRVFVYRKDVKYITAKITKGMKKFIFELKTKKTKERTIK